MNFWWPYFISKKTRDAAKVLFDHANLASRDPTLYEAGAVPDTLDGRFQALGLFAALAMHETADKQLRQALFDRFFMTCEASLREIGVGDLSVPYKLKTMMKAFHGHALVYHACLDTGQGWDEALSRNLYPDSSPSPAQLAVVKAAIEGFRSKERKAAA